MAIRDNIPIYVLHDLRCQFIDTSFERNGKTIFVPLNRIYFTAVEQKILSGNSHYFDCLLSHLGKLSKEKSAVSRSVSGTVKEIRKKYPKSVIEILVLVQMELLRAHIWMEKRCM